MTTKCENTLKNKSKQSRSVSDRLDAENRRIAKKIYKLQFINGLYGGLDGLSISLSTISLVFNFLYTDSKTSSSDVMHDWMMTPGGIAISAAEAVSLIGFSLLANIFSDKDKNAYKRYIAIIWPYLRDSLKGIKNAYKGVRNTLQAFGMLMGQDLRYMIVPMGFFLGAVSIMNRIFMRKFVREPRKEMMRANAALLLEIQATGDRDLHLLLELPEPLIAYRNSYILVRKNLYYVDGDGKIEAITLDKFDVFSTELAAINADNQRKIRLTERQIQNLIQANGGHIPPPGLNAAACNRYRSRIKKQSTLITVLAYASASYGGFVDGLYLFMGVMGLAMLASAAFTTLLVFSTLFSLMCIVTRIYEEYDLHRRLKASQAKIEVTLLGKELESILADLQRLSDPSFELLDTHTELTIHEQQEKALKSFETTLKAFLLKKKYLQAQITLTYYSAMFEGIKNGISAYCAIGSLMFAVATIYAIISVPFPPIFLITCVVAGLACLIAFVIHALVVNYRHMHPKEEKTEEEKQPLFKEKKKIEEAPQLEKYLRDIKSDLGAVRALEPTKVKEAILQGMVVDPSPQFFFQEWFEVVRSFFSGLSKGQKSVDFTLNALQEPDQYGHYHDTPIMFGVTALSAVIYSVALAIRAHGRGFGRPDISEVKSQKAPEITTKLSGDEKINSNDKPTNREGAGGEITNNMPEPTLVFERKTSLPLGLPETDHPHDVVNSRPSSTTAQSGFNFFSQPPAGRFHRSTSVDNLMGLVPRDISI